MSLSADILENSHVHLSPFVKENVFRLAGPMRIRLKQILNFTERQL